MSIILILQRLMQENQEFKASLDYRMRSCSSKQTFKINFHFGLPQMSQSWTLRSTFVLPLVVLAAVLVTSLYAYFPDFEGQAMTLISVGPNAGQHSSLSPYIFHQAGVSFTSILLFSLVRLAQHKVQLQARTLRGNSVVPLLFQDSAGFLVFGLLGSEHS